MNTRKLTLMALLLAFALIIFTLEAQIPPVVPVPGIKLGLSNIIILISIYLLGRKEAFTILILRIVLTCVFTGNFVWFLYSVSGALVCFAVMAITSRFLKEDRVWAVSVLGAIGHNCGQIAMAVALMKTPELVWYLPVLIISGIITGAFTGIAAQFTLKQLRKIKENKNA